MSHEAPHSLLSRMGRPAQGRAWLVVALVLLLMIGQALRAGHEALHVTGGDGPDCALCLIGGGAGAGLVSAPAPLVPYHGAAVALLGALPGSSIQRPFFRPQSPRAPPAIASIVRP